MPSHTMRVPQLSANEADATVVTAAVKRGDHVTPGQMLCILETTKSAVEILAEAEGYLHEWRAEPGSTMRAGDELCVINPAPLVASAASPATAEPSPAELQITGPARRLAEQLGIGLADLPRNRLITEGVVRGFAAETAVATGSRAPILSGGEERPADSRKAIIFGGGGHAAVLIDLLRQTHFLDIEGIVDDAPTAPPILGVPVLGTRAILTELRNRGIGLAVNAVGGINNIETRVAIHRVLAENRFRCPGLIHPRAVIDPSVLLDDAHQILAMAYVGSRSRLGYGVLVNTSAVVSHDCIVGDFAHIAPGALLAGGVSVGTATLVGMGVTTAVGIHIGARCRIGNGARIFADVPDHTTVRAGTSWPAPASAL